MRKFSVLVIALAFVACAPEPADPEHIFATAFDVDRSQAQFVDNGGTVDDGWLVFDFEQRVDLVNSDRYQALAPAAAVAFFADNVPEHQGDLADPADFVCLAWRETSKADDHGAFLLFKPGSSRYYFRLW